MGLVLLAVHSNSELSHLLGFSKLEVSKLPRQPVRLCRQNFVEVRLTIFTRPPPPSLNIKASQVYHTTFIISSEFCKGGTNNPTILYPHLHEFYTFDDFVLVYSLVKRVPSVKHLIEIVHLLEIKEERLYLVGINSQKQNLHCLSCICVLFPQNICHVLLPLFYT